MSFRRLGHEAVDVRDVGLRKASDDVIAKYAQREGLCLITADFDFSDVRAYPPQRFPGLVVLTLHATATSSYINTILESFLQEEEILGDLPGKLAIVEAGRVRLRSS